MPSSQSLAAVPTFDKLLWPTLKAIKALGGSASTDEIVDKIIELEGYSEEVQKFQRPGEHRTELEYRSAWARTYLKKAGALNNSSRGVWVILEKGEKLKLEDMTAIPTLVNKIVSEENAEKEKTKNKKKKKKRSFKTTRRGMLLKTGKRNLLAGF